MVRKVLSKDSSYEEQESLPEDDVEDEDDEEEEDYEQQSKVTKVKITIKKEEKSTHRGRPKNEKPSTTEILGLKPNIDQNNLNCLLFKFRLEVMSTDEISQKYKNGMYNASSGLQIKEEDNPSLDNEDNSTVKKKQRRQKSKEELKSEIQEKYKQTSKNKQNKDAKKLDQEEQKLNNQYKTEAMKPLDPELGRELTDVEQQLVDMTQQTKEVLEDFFFRKYDQMKKEYGLLDKLVFNILQGQTHCINNIESLAEGEECSVIPPFFWKVVAEIFQDTYHQKLSPFYCEIFGSD